MTVDGYTSGGWLAVSDKCVSYDLHDLRLLVFSVAALWEYTRLSAARPHVLGRRPFITW